jgi:hypothetical protein
MFITSATLRAYHTSRHYFLQRVWLTRTASKQIPKLPAEEVIWDQMRSKHVHVQWTGNWQSCGFLHDCSLLFPYATNTSLMPSLSLSLLQPFMNRSITCRASLYCQPQLDNSLIQNLLTFLSPTFLTANSSLWTQAQHSTGLAHAITTYVVCMSYDENYVRK